MNYSNDHNKVDIQVLISHLKSFILVPKALEARLVDIAKPLALDSGVFLHQPNKVCENTYFIKKGLVRIFYEKDDKQITDNFCAENEWVTSVYSFMRNIPDHFYIQTLERSELIMINIHDLESLFQEFHEMERFGRMLIAKLFVEHSERTISFKFNSAKEKYHFFCKTSKNKLNRVPLGMLASFLGITQETLSRIRADKSAF